MHFLAPPHYSGFLNKRFLKSSLGVARNARVAAALCSVRVRRIFHAINEFGGVMAFAIPVRVVGGARIRTRRVRVSKRTERALRLLRPPSPSSPPPPPPPSPQTIFFTSVLCISGFVRERSQNSMVTWKPQLRRGARHNWAGKSRYSPCFVFYIE
jgi:hypothetical protein